jgi:hypothetical protein
MTDEERAALKKRMQERADNLQETIVRNQQVSKDKSENKKAISVLGVSITIICVVVVWFVAISLMNNKNSNTVDKSSENTTVAEETVNVEPVTFHLVNQGEYVRNGRKCGLYRVYADKTDMTDDEMIVSFNTFIKELKDKYYLHDVMIYSSAEKADGGNAFDVADIEQTTESKTPVITRGHSYE